MLNLLLTCFTLKISLSFKNNYLFNNFFRHNIIGWKMFNFHIRTSQYILNLGHIYVRIASRTDPCQIGGIYFFDQANIINHKSAFISMSGLRRLYLFYYLHFFTLTNANFFLFSFEMTVNHILLFYCIQPIGFNLFLDVNKMLIKIEKRELFFECIFLIGGKIIFFFLTCIDAKIK
jgi:hypothetical protein